MKILVIGAGTVGMATGKGFLRFGHDVTFYDVSDVRRKELVTQDYRVSETLVDDADIIFICTPETVVENVIDQLIHEQIQGLKVIRSTVLPGTTNRIATKTAAYNHICHNPEFLREEIADWDFMRPYRIVLGYCCDVHRNLLEKLYEPFRAPIVRVTPTEAEMIKLASNAHLAMLISFWNELDSLCRSIGVNSHVVGKVVSMDPRISDYGAVQHGTPYGLRCLPKDTSALIDFMREKGVEPLLLRAVHEVNERMKR